MMRISVGSLAKYGPCSKAINESLYYSTGRKKSGYPKKMSSGEPSKLGTALHEIVQKVLSSSSEARTEEKKKMLEVLIKMRTNCTIPPEVDKILGNEFLTGSYESKMIQDLANDGITLLHNSFDLLTKLEEEYPGSESKWTIEIEHCLHDEVNGGPYEHSIFNENTELRAYVDIVFTWRDNVVLGELKSGQLTDDNEKIWKRQIAAYADIWGKLHSKNNIRGFVIHGSIFNGYQEAQLIDSPLQFQHENTESRIANEGCTYCDIRGRCSIFNE